LDTLKEISDVLNQDADLINNIETVVDQTMKYNILNVDEDINDERLKWNYIYDCGTINNSFRIRLPEPSSDYPIVEEDPDNI
jgi:hypothetical protein